MRMKKEDPEFKCTYNLTNFNKELSNYEIYKKVGKETKLKPTKENDTEVQTKKT